jgi:hypothetical protein
MMVFDPDQGFNDGDAKGGRNKLSKSCKGDSYDPELASPAIISSASSPTSFSTTISPFYQDALRLTHSAVM